ncbi:hypothetical protein AMECASPLE_035619 [Ameca splendens]|uniref:Uncharacterized protein n=1 Tax=Ameca splendens TaxID=208324 RepID=A0ABV0Y794_9TELE
MAEYSSEATDKRCYLERYTSHKTTSLDPKHPGFKSGQNGSAGCDRSLKKKKPELQPSSHYIPCVNLSAVFDTVNLCILLSILSVMGVGPFVRYYISQYGLLPHLRAGIAADRKGRRSSDVTVDCIRTPETPTFACKDRKTCKVLLYQSKTWI